MKYVLSLIVLGLLATPAVAAYQGPSTDMPTSTVKQALDGADDAPMCLEGNIANKVATSNEKYTFKDASGTIVMEIDDKVMATVNVTPNNTVRVCGKVDKEFGRTNEFEGKSLQIIK